MFPKSVPLHVSRSTQGRAGGHDRARYTLEEDAHGDLVYAFPRPWSDGPTGFTLSPLALVAKLAAVGPLPRGHLVRYAGCLAPHRQRRGALIPTPRPQGVAGSDANTGTPRWSWARLLKRRFDLALALCPVGRRGARRLMAAITHEAVSTRLLRHLQLAAVPPPMAPARARPATGDWVASCPRRRAWSRGRTCAQWRWVSHL